jgi:hypothetical protein
MPAVHRCTPFPTQAESYEAFVAEQGDIPESAVVANNEWHTVERRCRRGSPYQRARDEKTRTFERAKKLAAEMDVTAILDYIPMAERWGCHWAPPNKAFLVDPKRGELEWVGSRAKRLKNAGQMQRTKLYVCNGLVGPTVRQVVGEMMWRRDGWKTEEEMRRQLEKEWKRAEKEMSRIEEWQRVGVHDVDQWIAEEIEEEMEQERQGGWAVAGLDEWMAEAPKGYHQFLKQLDNDEIFEALTTGCATKQEFKDWLDQVVWERAEKQLEEDMKQLEMEKKVFGHELWQMQERAEWAEEAARNMV